MTHNGMQFLCYECYIYSAECAGAAPQGGQGGQLTPKHMIGGSVTPQSYSLDKLLNMPSYYCTVPIIYNNKILVENFKHLTRLLKTMKDKSS